MVIGDYKKINKDKKKNNIKTDNTNSVTESAAILKSLDIKSEIERINSDWKSTLKMIEENIQDIYSKRELLYKDKESYTQKDKNIQELMSELVLKIGNGHSQSLKNDYIKLSIESEKINKDICCVERQITEYNQALYQLIEKNNCLQTEYDKIKQNLNLEYSKFELLEKFNNISSEVAKLNIHEQQNVLNEIKNKNLEKISYLNLEQELNEKSNLEAELLKTSIEKKHHENLQKSVSFEKLFTDSKLKIEKDIQDNKKVDQLFK